VRAILQLKHAQEEDQAEWLRTTGISPQAYREAERAAARDAR
jgi:hypothetical protein